MSSVMVQAHKLVIPMRLWLSEACWVCIVPGAIPSPLDLSSKLNLERGAVIERSRDLIWVVGHFSDDI